MEQNNILMEYSGGAGKYRKGLVFIAFFVAMHFFIGWYYSEPSLYIENPGSVDSALVSKLGNVIGPDREMTNLVFFGRGKGWKSSESLFVNTRDTSYMFVDLAREVKLESKEKESTDMIGRSMSEFDFGQIPKNIQTCIVIEREMGDEFVRVSNYSVVITENPSWDQTNISIQTRRLASKEERKVLRQNNDTKRHVKGKYIYSTIDFVIRDGELKRRE